MHHFSTNVIGGGLGFVAARKAMKIAADCCIYTNHNFTIERIEAASSRSSEVVREAASMSASDSFVAAI
jgi:hypothetical protein